MSIKGSLRYTQIEVERSMQDNDLKKLYQMIKTQPSIIEYSECFKTSIFHFSAALPKPDLLAECIDYYFQKYSASLKTSKRMSRKGNSFSRVPTAEFYRKLNSRAVITYNSALDIAILNNRTENALFLIEQNISFDEAHPKNGMRALDHASKMNNLNVMHVLIRRIAESQFGEQYKEDIELLFSNYYFRADYRMLLMRPKLIQFLSIINRQNPFDNNLTALDYSIKASRYHCYFMLIKFGADLFQKDDNNKTYLQNLQHHNLELLEKTLNLLPRQSLPQYMQPQAKPHQSSPRKLNGPKSVSIQAQVGDIYYERSYPPKKQYSGNAHLHLSKAILSSKYPADKYTLRSLLQEITLKNRTSRSILRMQNALEYKAEEIIKYLGFLLRLEMPDNQLDSSSKENLDDKSIATLQSQYKAHSIFLSKETTTLANMLMSIYSEMLLKMRTAVSFTKLDTFLKEEIKNLNVLRIINKDLVDEYSSFLPKIPSLAAYSLKKVNLNLFLSKYNINKPNLYYDLSFIQNKNYFHSILKELESNIRLLSGLKINYLDLEFLNNCFTKSSKEELAQQPGKLFLSTPEYYQSFKNVISAISESSDNSILPKQSNDLLNKQVLYKLNQLLNFLKGLEFQYRHFSLVMYKILNFPTLDDNGEFDIERISKYFLGVAESLTSDFALELLIHTPANGIKEEKLKLYLLISLYHSHPKTFLKKDLVSILLKISNETCLAESFFDLKMVYDQVAKCQQAVLQARKENVKKVSRHPIALNTAVLQFFNNVVENKITAQQFLSDLSEAVLQMVDFSSQSKELDTLIEMTTPTLKNNVRLQYIQDILHKEDANNIWIKESYKKAYHRSKSGIMLLAVEIFQLKFSKFLSSITTNLRKIVKLQEMVVFLNFLFEILEIINQNPIEANFQLSTALNSRLAKIIFKELTSSHVSDIFDKLIKIQTDLGSATEVPMVLTKEAFAKKYRYLIDCGFIDSIEFLLSPEYINLKSDKNGITNSRTLRHMIIKCNLDELMQSRKLLKTANDNFSESQKENLQKAQCQIESFEDSCLNLILDEFKSHILPQTNSPIKFAKILIGVSISFYQSNGIHKELLSKAWDENISIPKHIQKCDEEYYCPNRRRYTQFLNGFSSLCLLLLMDSFNRELKAEYTVYKKLGELNINSAYAFSNTKRIYEFFVKLKGILYSEINISKKKSLNLIDITLHQVIDSLLSYPQLRELKSLINVGEDKIPTTTNICSSQAILNNYFKQGAKIKNALSNRDELISLEMITNETAHQTRLSTIAMKIKLNSKTAALINCVLHFPYGSLQATRFSESVYQQSLKLASQWQQAVQQTSLSNKKKRSIKKFTDEFLQSVGKNFKGSKKELTDSNKKTTDLVPAIKNPNSTSKIENVSLKQSQPKRSRFPTVYKDDESMESPHSSLHETKSLAFSRRNKFRIFNNNDSESAPNSTSLTETFQRLEINPSSLKTRDKNKKAQIS